MKRPALEVLQELANEDAATRARDDAWIRRASGKASASDEAELAARAASSEEDALLLQTTTPLSDAKLDELLAFAERAAAPKVVSQNARRRAALAWGAPALAVAAAVTLFVRSRDPERPILPEYVVAVEGVDAEHRGQPSQPAAGERRIASAGAHLAIVARPQEPVRARVVAAAYGVQGSDVRELAVAPRVSASGTVTLEGTRESLFGATRGKVDVVVWVGASDAIPHAPGDALSPPRRGAQRIVVPLELP